MNNLDFIEIGRHVINAHDIITFNNDEIILHDGIKIGLDNILADHFKDWLKHISNTYYKLK